MIKLTKLHLHNVVTYKDAVLPLNKHKLLRVSGQNYDEGSRNSSNASGKSLLFTTLGSVLLNLVRSHASKGEKNTLIIGKESFASVFLVRNKIKYKITQYFSGSAKWEIERDGKKLEFRKAKDALAYIRTRIICVSDGQFYSQVVVDGRTKSILQSGTSTQRFEYFEDVFKLKAYDRLAEQANADYSRLKRLLQEAEVLAREHKEKESKLPGQTREELDTKHKEIETKFNVIRDKLDAALQKLTVVKTFIAVAESNETDKTLPELREELAEVEQEEEKLRKLQTKAVQYQENVKLHEKQTKKRNEVKSQLEELPEVLSPLEVFEDLKQSFEEKLKDVKIKLTTYIDIKQHNTAVQEKLNALEEGNEAFFAKYKSTPLKTLQKTVSNNKVEVRNLKESVDSLNTYISDHGDHDSSVCPTCLRDLTPVAAKQMVKTANQRIEKCSTNIRKLINLIAYNDLRNTMELLDPKLNEADLQKQQESFEKKLKHVRKQIEIAKERLHLQAVLESIPKLTTLGKACPDPDTYNEQIDEARKTAKSLGKAIQVKQRLRKLNLAIEFKSVRQAKEMQQELEAKLETYRPLIDKAQKILSNTSNKLSVLEIVQKDVDRLAQALDDLQSKTRNFKVYEALRKAFGPKGLRKSKTLFYATKLELNLNKYSHLIFNSAIKFKINVSNTKLDILAERNGKIDDVRSLSGAESTKFTMLLIVCILPFIAESERFNLIVLDEIESGLDDPSKDLFVKKYLPVLQQIVPHVIIITPTSEQAFYIPNTHKVVVSKRKGVSTLTEE